MSSVLSPIEALSRIPGWGDCAPTLRELRGGLTNRTYRVERDGGSFILRLDSEHTRLFGLDRACEQAILDQAAEQGLAPRVVFADADAGVLLSQYVAGSNWSVRDLERDSNLERLAELLRRVHALPQCGKSFDANRIARRYCENLSSHPDLHTYGIRCLKVIAENASTATPRCCHNDVVAENIVASPELILLDWEYACDNDELFDLASTIAYHDLSEAQAGVLLSAYAGGTDPARTEALRRQTCLFDALQWLWLANRQSITQSDAQSSRLERLQERIG